MGGHESPRMLKDEWLTPPEIVRALGEFDLDPCSPVVRPWDTAKEHFSILEDGLAGGWFGRVWLNPPYGKHTGEWLRLLAQHGRGTAFIFARTETQTFFEYVWDRASAVLFLRGRVSFYHVSGEKADGNGGAPSVLGAYGDDDA